MNLKRSTVFFLLILLLLALMVGTQMPGAWRDGIEHRLHAPFGLSSWAHFLIFTAMSCLAHVPPLTWTMRRITLVALALALSTEALQFLAINRHPGLDDVAIDMAGTVMGLLLARWRSRFAAT